MKNLGKKVVLILTVILILHSLAIAYFLIFKQYFQQDEWHSFGLLLSMKFRYVTLDHPFIDLLLGDRVGARFLNYSLFNVFGINSMPYGMFSFLFHGVNTFLVFLLAQKITKQKVVSLLSALFFLVNEVGNEGYSWFGTMNGSATSVIFFLISFLFFLNFIEKRKKYSIVFSFLFLWISLLFKETSLFALLLYPIVFWVYVKDKNKIKLLVKSLTIFFLFALVLFIFYAKTIIFIPGDRANYVATGNSFILDLLLHSIQYPLEGIIHVFFPNSFIFIISRFITTSFSSYFDRTGLSLDVIAENNNAELVVLFLLLVLGGIIFFNIYKKWSKMTENIKKSLLISMIMLILSFIPYIVINRSFSYLDSRHYYLAAVGGSIFLATFIYNVIGFKKKINLAISLMMIIGYVVLHDLILFSDFKLLEERSFERQLFLKQILKDVPNLQNKTIFFITGNSPGYYGLEELKVPFQSGLGHLLMVIYTTRNQLNPVFFKEEKLIKAFDVGFLYDILGQGYREIDGKGFGYYYDSQEIKKAINKKLFSKENIIYFNYDADFQILEKGVYK